MARRSGAKKERAQRACVRVRCCRSWHPTRTAAAPVEPQHSLCAAGLASCHIARACLPTLTTHTLALPQVTGEDVESIIKEIEIMKEFKSAFIVRYFGNYFFQVSHVLVFNPPAGFLTLLRCFRIVFGLRWNCAQKEALQISLRLKKPCGIVALFLPAALSLCSRAAWLQ